MKLQGKANAWIKPSGQFIEVEYMCHDEWAYEYFETKYGTRLYLDRIEKICKSPFNAYPHVALHKLGWVRLLTWTDKQTKVLGNCTPNDSRLDTMDSVLTWGQKKTLQDWCMSNSFKYEDLFKDK